MAKLISASIDFAKMTSSPFTTPKGTKCVLLPINQAGITEKDGKFYLNFTIGIEDEPNKFGQDCSITLAQTKEQREAKAPKVYIGNGKTVWESGKPDPAKLAGVEPLVNPNFNELDLPF